LTFGCGVASSATPPPPPPMSFFFCTSLYRWLSMAISVVPSSPLLSRCFSPLVFSAPLLVCHSLALYPVCAPSLVLYYNCANHATPLVSSITPPPASLSRRPRRRPLSSGRPISFVRCCSQSLSLFAQQLLCLLFVMRPCALRGRRSGCARFGLHAAFDGSNTHRNKKHR
jgi:hypothetical protein